MTNTETVRSSREGDQFHYHWAARQCLSLLSRTDDLAAVTIEGSSAMEVVGSPLEKGDEVIDVGLYYGSERLTVARTVRYIQLKHSTRQSQKHWTASGLETTLSGFAQRYKEITGHLPWEVIHGGIRFEFTTNRPIEEKLEATLADLATGAAPRHPTIANTLVGYTGLTKDEALRFFSIFSVFGEEPDLWMQRNLLFNDVQVYLVDSDSDLPLRLKELVTRKATTEFSTNPSIRRHDVLRAIRTTEEELFPSPSLIAAPVEVLPREQEDELRKTVLSAQHPVVIHADGGVGKSVIALRLAATMPVGSEAILYDCFGDGLYRTALHSRHRHSDAITQIANELAARGLCTPLVPTVHADAKQYMRALSRRLEQGAGLLRARNAEACLCIVVDAADNADMAAEERQEACFVRDLIRMSVPPGVKLAFTARTHRLDRLAAPVDALMVALAPFSQQETGRHLRATYPDASDQNVAEFSFLSSANPRVQALALAQNLPLHQMLKELGPTPTTVESALANLLQRAIKNLKDQVGTVESRQVDAICEALAVLRPLVPLAVLADLSGTSESAIRSFASDIGRPLLVKGGSLHFLDEPTETWFREAFKPDRPALAKFLEKLLPMANRNAYVASVVPQLFLAAGRLDELVQLALSGDALPNQNPLERRDVDVQRLTVALKACMEEKRYLLAAKLALRAAGELAGESRQNDLIQENTDIAAEVLSPDRLDDIVSRRTFRASWRGGEHAYDAGLLSARSEFSGEAASRLRMAMEWLNAWADSSDKDSQDEHIDDSDRAEIAITILRLHGANKAVAFLRSWTDRTIAFTTGKLVARRLVDVAGYDQVDALANAAGHNAWLLLALAQEMYDVGHVLSTKPLNILIEMLGDSRLKLPEFTGYDDKWSVLYAVHASVSMAIRALPEKRLFCADVLRKYLPEQPPDSLSDKYGFDCAPMVRAYALEAALRGNTLQLFDIAPADVRKHRKDSRPGSYSPRAEAFDRLAGGLLPWMIISADAVVGRDMDKLDSRLAMAADSTAKEEARDYQSQYNIRHGVAQEWLSILRSASATDAPRIAALREWIGTKKPLGTSTLTSMCRRAARVAGLEAFALELATAARETVESSSDGAEEQIRLYQLLTRAVITASRPEAVAYFNRAVEIASRIGDENTQRWSSLLCLAEAASEKAHPRSKSAYHLARAAELTYRFVAADKYFDWERTVDALAALSGTGCLAILSRWRDRRFGESERLLPSAIDRLVDERALPVTTPVVLAGTSGSWNRIRDLRRAVDAESSIVKRQQLVGTSYRYIRVLPYDREKWSEVAGLAAEIGVDLPDLARLVNAPERERGEAQHDRHFAVDARATLEEPKWNEIFSGVDLLNADALKCVYEQCRAERALRKPGVFFAEIVGRVGVGRLPELIDALATWQDFGTYELNYLLGVLPKPLPAMLSLRTSVAALVLTVCYREPEKVQRRGIAGYWEIERFLSEGFVSNDEMILAALNGFTVQADSLSASGLFQLVELLSLRLSANEADDGLSFGLDLLANDLRPEDGDGDWTDLLEPPPCCVTSLAGYVWAGLGSPKADVRWESAHVVRTAIELEWDEFLTALAGHSVAGVPHAFVDGRLPFYEWHARQWLLIALARGAVEYPMAVKPFVSLVENSLTEEHVLIRAFAAQTLASLAAAGVAQLSEEFRPTTINAPQLPVEVHSGWREPDDDEPIGGEAEAEEDYRFSVDIGPYWFAPLGMSFGLTERATTELAKKAIGDRLGGGGGRADDPRYAHDIYGGQETSHSHGSMPETDDLLAYHAYHAMMIVAARLLKSRPVRQSDHDDADGFTTWLHRRLLTPPSGRWLADYRDPALYVDSHAPDSYGDDIWRWSITSDYIDRQLKTDDGLNVLWGSWSTGSSSQREVVSVRSALVPRRSAESLLVALQTARKMNDYAIPADQEDTEVEYGPFKLVGWITSDDSEGQLDEADPWALGLKYSAPSPSTKLFEKLAMTQSSDDRQWQDDMGLLLRRELSSEAYGYGRDKETSQGARLSGPDRFISRFLSAFPDYLLVASVSVRRSARRNVDTSNAPYIRYYLLDADGIPRSL